MSNFLSVGFATRDDFDGAWMTVETLIEFHDDYVDQIVIVDNSPENSRHAKMLAEHVKTLKKVKYVRDSGPASSCVPKNKVFTESDCEFAANCDSHVVFKKGAIRAVREFWRGQAADTPDILTGPCWAGAANNRCMGTNQMLYEHEGYDPHGKPPDYQYMTAWRGGCCGVWVLDPRGRSPDMPPFKIRKHGTGFFSMRRDAWVGFMPTMTGHGGNEAYLYEKVRRNGGTAWCLPAAGWIHKFGRANGVPYALNWADRVSNYVNGFRDLDRPDLERGAIEHFKKVCAGTVRSFLKKHGETPNHREELCGRLGLQSGNAAPEGIADAIRQISRPGMATLELGSGYSTLVFERAGCTHLALEHNEKYAHHVQSKTNSKATRVMHAPLGESGAYFNGDPPACVYDKKGGYELVLVDGPPNVDGGDKRHGAVEILHRLAAVNATIIVDDTHRPGDAALSKMLAESRGLNSRSYKVGNRQFDVLVPKRA